MPISILELALHRGAKEEPDGSLNGGEFERVGLPIFAGCEVCEASLSAANAFPSKSGFIRCKACIGKLGWENAGEANQSIFEGE